VWRKDSAAFHKEKRYFVKVASRATMDSRHFGLFREAHPTRDVMLGPVPSIW
jgi:hypothetical protein